MPIQAPQWTEFLSCPVCCNEFDADTRGPVSLGCGHSICRGCLASLHRKQCPFDQSQIRVDVLKIPLNGALVRLVGGITNDEDVDSTILAPYHLQFYKRASQCIQELALYLKPFSSGSISVLSRPMQRKLVTLTNCQLLEAEGRTRALRAARSLGERTVTELLLQHQNPQQLSANLWAAVRARGCQFLGPAMQEEVLKLVLLALEDGSALSRKVLVMFVVQRLEPHYSQASKTSIGHVVQLLYRASCFKVSKREGDSSLMQLKEEFRSYEALRREHDAQIVQIATEAGLRIAPDQWSALLYGDTAHKSHMQSIMDKLQTPQSFSQSVQELIMALQRSGDPGNLSPLRCHLELLAGIDPSPESSVPSWEDTTESLDAARVVVAGLAEFISQHGSRRQQDSSHASAKYKVSMCRDLTLRGSCPRGTNCTFAHSESELDKFRARSRKLQTGDISNNSLSFDNSATLENQNISTSTGYQSSGNSTYENDVYRVPVTQVQPISLTPQSYLPVSNSRKADSIWETSGKYMGVPRARSLAALQQRKLEILCQLTGTPSPLPEHDDFVPFEQTVVNKYGPISRFCQDSQSYGYEETIPTNSTFRNASVLQWTRLPPQINTEPYLFVSSPDQAQMYVQAPQDLLAESQRMKQQLRHLEKRIMDLKLAASGTTMEENQHNHHLVDELQKIQDSLQEEELYEAGIAKDMKELEQRWVSELEEQERRWTENEPRPLN